MKKAPFLRSEIICAVSLALMFCLAITSIAFAQTTRVTHREPGEAINSTHPGLIQANLFKQSKANKFMAPTASAIVCLANVYVDAASGNDGNDGDTPATAKATIQAGIDAVCDGGIVHVYPGSYSETATGRSVLGVNGPHQFGLFIDKSDVTIQGVDGSGTPITDYSSVLAEVETNATNNFGFSGIFVEGDGVTIRGLKILPNVPEDNKTIEIIGDDFTLRYCHIAVPAGGSVYFNDWQFDAGTSTSYVQSYIVEANFLATGTSIDLASGAGFSGPVSGRVIKDNKFANSEFWPSISFNGSDTGVPWFVYSVGGAEITGNDFTNTYNTISVTAAHIRARGTYDNSQFDWESYWNDNTFNKAVVTLVSAPFNVRTYSYVAFYGPINDVRRIGLTIQGEINNAVAGDKVLVNEGTYVENPVVEKDLTLEGVGATTTIIKAPSSIPVASNPASTVVDVKGAGVEVEISDFTISGPGPSGCGSIGYGIFVHDGADANIHDNRILDIRDHPFSGCQNGVAIQVGRAAWSTSGTATITDNIISGYQKNGITISNVGSSATISGNTVTGAGPTTVNAQNGIQVSSGATADINDNEVSGHSYTPFTYVATGMLLYGSDANTDGNTVSENQVGIYHIEGSGTHDGNTVSASGSGTGSPSFWGIVVDDPPARRQPSPLDIALSTKAVTSKTAATLNGGIVVIVKNNVLTGDGTTAGVGLEADAGYGAPDIDFTATNNFIKDWGYGVAFTTCTSGCTGSTFTNLKLNFNSITGNLVGVDNSSGVAADGEKNWWASNTGPTHASNPSGTGNSVSDDVDFDPWLCSGSDTSPAKGFQPTSSTSPCGGPPPAASFVLLAKNDITLNKFTLVEGDVHANGKITYKQGNNPSTHDGNAQAVSTIKIQSGNTVDGDVTSGGTVSNSGTVTGTITQNAGVSPESLPSLSFSAGATNVTVPKNGTMSLTPGSYGTVKVLKGATLELSGGEYFMKSLEAGENSTLEMDVTGDPITVNVVGMITFGKKSVVEILPGGEDATDQVTFNCLHTQVKLLDGARVLGSIVAPNATLSLATGSRLKGSITAKTITVNKNVTVLGHGSSTPLPKVNPGDIDGEIDSEVITALPTEYELSQNYPNPFNPSTTIKFAMPEAGRATLRIYALTGQLVQTLIDGEMSAGRHNLSWNGRDQSGLAVASGIYFYRLEVQKQNGEAAFMQTRRMAFVK